MKYQPGKFSIVPNRDYLCGKPPILQCLFLWLCVHSDEAGICFPSRKKLSEECNCDKRSIDKYMKVLEDDGVVKKTLRYNKRKKRNDSNLYQIMLNSEPITPPSEPNVEKQGEPNDTVTITNINYKQSTTSEQVKPVHEGDFSFEGYIKQVMDSSFIVINDTKRLTNPARYFAAYFLKRKGLKFNSREAIEGAMKRHYKAAKELGAFTSDMKRVSQAFNDAENLVVNGQRVNWGLETVVKMLTK
jgi:hypothetical protein